MRSKVLSFLLGALASLVLLVALWTKTTSLQQQNAVLAQQLAALAKENEALLKDAQSGHPPARANLELLRLRNEVSMLRNVTNALMQASSPTEQASSESAQAFPAPIAPIPAESWAYTGYATPEASIQTAAWAMRTGNLEQYLACFTPEDRALAVERFKGKSALEVQRMLIVEIASTQALRLDRKMVLDDGTVGFTISSREVDGGLTVSKEERVLRFKNVGGEWKFAN